MGAVLARPSAWVGRHLHLTVGGLLAVAAVLGFGGYWWAGYSEARTHYRAAEQAADRRDWKAARESLKDALRLWPDRPEVHLLAARVERRLEHLGEAGKHLDACERLQGGPTEPVKVERALVRVHDGGLADVEAYLRDRVRQDDPAAVEILDILAGALEIGYRDAEAHWCLLDLLRRQPDHFDALVRAGRTARNMGWHEDAIQYYEKALRVRPDVDVVRTALAETQVGYGRHDQAREHFERLRERDPQNPAVRYGLALCAVAAGDADTALRLFNQLLAANPNNWVVLNERGKLAVQLDRPADALPDLLKAESLAPPDAAPTHLVGCLHLLGRHDEARKYQEKVDRIQADRRRSAELGDLIREKHSNDPELRYELGRVLLRLGKQRDAVHWLRSALEKDPGHRKSHEALAEFFQSVNAVELAEQHRRILQRLGAGPR